MIELPLSQTPESLLARIAEMVHSYSTALVKMSVDHEGHERIHQIGSGTFVSVGDTYGILTAQHVSNELHGPCDLGLALIRHEHVLRIKKDYLKIIEIASASIPSEGPDLSFIALPASNVSTIKAVKSFLELSFDKDKILNNPPPLDFGIWFICGTPSEGTEEEESEKGFGGVISSHGNCGATGVNREYVMGDYDYIEVGIDYSGSGGIPSNFGGMSGGGLWQVLTRQTEEGELEPTKHLLSGVIFYQSDVINQRRFIRCHGRRSIYKNVFDKIESQQ